MCYNYSDLLAEPKKVCVGLGNSNLTFWEIPNILLFSINIVTQQLAYLIMLKTYHVGMGVGVVLLMGSESSCL